MARGGAGGKSWRARRAGPQALESTLGLGRRLRLALAPRGRWARHAHAANADTATRAGRWGRGAESSCAPVRLPRAPAAVGAEVGRGSSHGRRSDVSLSPLPQLALLPVQPRPHPAVPARLNGRGTSSAPPQGKRQIPFTQLRPHTRVLRRRAI